jgi:hypothetical protein
VRPLLFTKIATYGSGLGFFGFALHQVFNEGDFDGALRSVLQGAAALGFGHAIFSAHAEAQGAQLEAKDAKIAAKDARQEVKQILP